MNRNRRDTREKNQNRNQVYIYTYLYKFNKTSHRNVVSKSPFHRVCKSDSLSPFFALLDNVEAVPDIV